MTAWDPVMEFIETPTVDAVVLLDSAKDERGVECALLTLHLENDKTVRLPVPIHVAMRVWALLDDARKDHGWSEPTTPVLTDKMR